MNDALAPPWVDPWQATEGGGPELVAELRRELRAGHVLFGHNVVAIGRRIDCDDVLFQLDDGTLAVVHLTWSGSPDAHPDFPWTRRYQTVEAFVQQVLLPDARERNESA